MDTPTRNVTIECPIADYPVVAAWLNKYKVKYERSKIDAMLTKKEYYLFTIPITDEAHREDMLRVGQSIAKKVFVGIKVSG